MRSGHAKLLCTLPLPHDGPPTTSTTVLSPPPLTINTYGGWGDEYYYSFVAPYYKEEYKTARGNRESGGAVLNAKLRFNRHVVAVTVSSRENARMLAALPRCHSPGWRRAPSRWAPP